MEQSAQYPIIPGYEVIVLDEIPLGEGSYGTVYRGLCYHMNVAIKLLDCSADNLDEACLNEANILKDLRHKNIVFFLGVCMDPPCIITEFCSQGSLFDFLRRENELKMSLWRGVYDTSLWIKKLGLLIDVAQGMCFLHNRHNPVLHLDLKSPNVLVRSNWEAAVGDFGLSNFVSGSIKSMNGMNPKWLAPEVLNNGPPTAKSDVYPFGIIMWEVLTDCIPWKGYLSAQIEHEVLKYNRRPEVNESQADPPWKSLYIQLMKKCWSEDLCSRPEYSVVVSELKEIQYKLTGKREREEGVPLKSVVQRPYVIFAEDITNVYKEDKVQGAFFSFLSLLTCGVLGRKTERKKDLHENPAGCLFGPPPNQPSPFDAVGAAHFFEQSYEDSEHLKLGDSGDSDLFYSFASFELDGTARNANRKHERHYFKDPEELAEGIPQKEQYAVAQCGWDCVIEEKTKASIQVVDKTVPELERWEKIRTYLLNVVEASEQYSRWKKLIEIARANRSPPADASWRQFLRCFFGPITTDDDVRGFRSSKHWSALKGYMLKKKVPMLAPVQPKQNNCASSSTGLSNIMQGSHFQTDMQPFSHLHIQSNLQTIHSNPNPD